MTTASNNGADELTVTTGGIKGKHMSEEQKVQDFETWDDIVLYDVFAESATRLDGWLIAQERKARAAGDGDQADAWRRESFALADERREIAATDRQAQAAAIVRWNERRAAIDAGADPLSR